MFLKFKDEVSSILSTAIAKSGFETDDLALAESPHADLASSVGFKLASKYKQSPKVISEKIYANISLQADSYVARAANGRAFILIFL